MNLLIAYDGSRCSEAALDDLVRFGLPEIGECQVISVAEVWLPPDGHRTTDDIEATASAQKVIHEHYGKDEMVVAEARTFAEHAKRRFRLMFPGWTVNSSATYGSPAQEILTKADEMSADLIVVGSNGHSALGRLFLGSVSQKIVTEARCSVRIARGRVEVDPFPSRIVIGFDGSAGARVAVESVASRLWREQSEVRLVALIDDGKPAAIGRFTEPSIAHSQETSIVQHDWVENGAAEAGAKLSSAGLAASVSVCAGSAKEILVREAEHWNADCIFVGATSQASSIGRFLLGSTSSAVASRAHCSVEVVRSRNIALS